MTTREVVNRNITICIKQFVTKSFKFASFSIKVSVSDVIKNAEFMLYVCETEMGAAYMEI